MGHTISDRLCDAPEDDETYAYTLTKIETILAVVPEPAAHDLLCCCVHRFATR